MDITAAKKRLTQLYPPEQLLENEPLSRHTTLQIGGPAAFVVQPNSVEQLQQTVQAVQDFPFFIMGNGSNLLVSDRGYQGIVIKLCGMLSRIDVTDDRITAQSGALLSRIANTAAGAGLSGLEFASGIPGTLGGALMMNAGAYGGEMKDVVLSSSYMDRQGNIGEVVGEAHDFGYRHSIFEEEDWIVLSSTLQLTPKDKGEIRALTQQLTAQRTSKQPLNLPSAGSVFKRPEGFFAGKLVQDACLAGYQIGGAQVSEKHCGFIVNKGNATCADFMALVEEIRQKVYLQFGVELELEIKQLGD